MQIESFNHKVILPIGETLSFSILSFVVTKCVGERKRFFFRFLRKLKVLFFIKNFFSQHDTDNNDDVSALGLSFEGNRHWLMPANAWSNWLSISDPYFSSEDICLVENVSSMGILSDLIIDKTGNKKNNYFFSVLFVLILVNFKWSSELKLIYYNFILWTFSFFCPLFNWTWAWDFIANEWPWLWNVMIAKWTLMCSSGHYNCLWIDACKHKDWTDIVEWWHWLRSDSGDTVNLQLKHVMSIWKLISLKIGG